MDFLIALFYTSVFTVIFKEAIKRHPLVFYLLGAALVGWYLYACAYGAPVLVWKYLLTFIKKCHLATSFFTIVMFIGVLSPSSKIRLYLNPIRSELSIIGSILACGHVIGYVSPFIQHIRSGFVEASPKMVAMILLSFVVVVMLAVLTITSFTFVRKKMTARSWKHVQRLAYPFFLLIFIHALLYLMPAVLYGSRSSINLTAALYSVLFFTYIILRSIRELKECGVISALGISHNR